MQYLLSFNYGNIICGVHWGNNSSKIVLDKINCKNKLYLANSKVDSCKQMEKALTNNVFDRIIIIGQKPLIKNKICLETIATQNGNTLKTNFNLEYLISKLRSHKLDYKISAKPGCSYCNNIYYFTLDRIRELKQNSQIILIHIPFVKNFKDGIENFIGVLNAME